MLKRRQGMNVIVWFVRFVDLSVAEMVWNV